jgi:hypothetical protein
VRRLELSHSSRSGTLFGEQVLVLTVAGDENPFGVALADDELEQCRS